MKSRSIYAPGNAVTPAFADHLSPMGAGWANMPNDIHDTRIDTRLADENEEFISFVQYGIGAASVNRFLIDRTTAPTHSLLAGPLLIDR